ncbi:MAG TPA: hypothetical protein VMC85_19420 [Desulfomonilaceae bacterium]|nr:hypothetical protein [Desulfomonilaceae bacterium]
MDYLGIGDEMLVSLALVWLLWGIINQCLVYVWARRSFDIRNSICLVVLGPVFFAVIVLLAMMVFLISTWVDQNRLREGSLTETTRSRVSSATKIEAAGHGPPAYGASPESDGVGREQHNTDNVPDKNGC